MKMIKPLIGACMLLLVVLVTVTTAMIANAAEATPAADPVSWLEKAGLIIVAITSLIGAASAIVKLTPSPKDDAVVGKVRKVWYGAVLPIFEKLSLTTEGEKKSQ